MGAAKKDHNSWSSVVIGGKICLLGLLCDWDIGSFGKPRKKSWKVSKILVQKRWATLSQAVVKACSENF